VQAQGLGDRYQEILLANTDCFNHHLPTICPCTGSGIFVIQNEHYDREIGSQFA
jgi:hypothetical protein